MVLPLLCPCLLPAPYPPFSDSYLPYFPHSQVLTDVVSQSDLVKLLWEHKEALELAKTLTVEELGLVYSAVFTVSAETTALEAYHHMCMDHKSCIGVTDADGKLVGNLSLSDLRGLDQDHCGLLLLPESEMIAILQGTKVSCCYRIDYLCRMEGPELSYWPKAVLTHDHGAGNWVD